MIVCRGGIRHSPHPFYTTYRTVSDTSNGAGELGWEPDTGFYGQVFPPFHTFPSNQVFLSSSAPHTEVDDEAANEPLRPREYAAPESLAAFVSDPSSSHVSRHPSMQSFEPECAQVEYTREFGPGRLLDDKEKTRGGENEDCM
jgi:hypothetical protein